MGQFSDQLAAVAAAASATDPAPDLLDAAATDLRGGARKLEHAVRNPGLKGAAADQITSLFTEHQELAGTNAEAVARIKKAAEEARHAMADAADAYRRLPGDSIPSWISNVVKAGGVVTMGPFGKVASEAALGAVQSVLSSAREREAKQALDTLSAKLGRQIDSITEATEKLEPPRIVREWSPGPEPTPSDDDPIGPRGGTGFDRGNGTSPGVGDRVGLDPTEPGVLDPGDDTPPGPGETGVPDVPTPDYPVPPVFPTPPPGDNWHDPIVPGGPGGPGDESKPPSGPPYSWDPPGYTPPSVDGGGGISGVDPLGGGMYGVDPLGGGLTGAGLLAGGALGARALGGTGLGSGSALGASGGSSGAGGSSGLFGSAPGAGAGTASSAGAFGAGSGGRIGATGAGATGSGGRIGATGAGTAGSSGSAGRSGGMMGGGMGAGGSGDKKRAGGARYVAARIDDDTPVRRGPIPGAEASSRAELAKKAPRRQAPDTSRLT